LLTKFPGLETTGRHNSAMITNAENSPLTGPPTRCLVFIFIVIIMLKPFPWAVAYASEVASEFLICWQKLSIGP